MIFGRVKPLYRSRHLGRGTVEVHQPQIHDLAPGIPGLDEEPAGAD